MAYNFLGLVNDLCSHYGEVQLNSTNFASAIGEYAQFKRSTNAAIRRINQEQIAWPFNHVTQTDTLTAGTTRYDYPSDAKLINFLTFRIKRNDTFNNETKYLHRLDYEEYLQKYVDQEYLEEGGDDSKRDIPTHIIRTPDRQFALYPVPDEAYELVYEYYQLPTDLVLQADVPSIPEQFRYVINEGAMFYCEKFRGNDQGSVLHSQNFLEMIKDMRGIYINRYEYARSTMIPTNRATYNTGYGDF